MDEVQVTLVYGVERTPENSIDWAVWVLHRFFGRNKGL